MEKALLSGGFDAIKWHIGNRELNVKLGGLASLLQIK